MAITARQRGYHAAVFNDSGLRRHTLRLASAQSHDAKPPVRISPTDYYR